MCLICASFRPWTPSCDYDGLPTDPSGDPNDTDVTAAPPAGGYGDPGASGGTTANVAVSILEETTDAAANTSTTYSMDPFDTFLGTLSSAGDRDWIAITLEAGVEYEINLTGEFLTDPYLRVYDSTGTLVAENDDANGVRDSELAAFTVASTGTYYLSAGAWNDNFTGDYRLTVFGDPITADLDALAGFLTDGYWNTSGRNRHSFDTDASGGVITVDLTGLNADGLALARWALESWEAVIDVDFQEVSSGADITFDDEDGQTDPSQFYAYAGYTASGYDTISSEIFVSQGWVNYYGAEIDGYAFQTYVHEIGHALGLGHLGAYNGGANYGSDETFTNDSWAVSIMSYFSQSENGTVSSDYAALMGPMIADIVAAQELYGAADSSSLTGGNTTYGANHTLGSSWLGLIFDEFFQGIDHPEVDGRFAVAATIYDVSGYDVLDFSTSTIAMNVDLNEEAVSSVGGVTGNFTIARGTVLEEIRAGSGDDTLTGNGSANRLYGYAGDDTLNGEAGNDRLYGGAGSDVHNGGNGRDRADYTNAGAGVAASLTSPGSNTGDAAGDTFNSIEDLGGSDYNDTLTGNGSANRLYGYAGDDTLNGEAGNDRLYGGAGSDVLNGGNGRDRADYTNAGAGVTADLSNSTNNTGDAAGDTFNSIEDLGGSKHDDVLTGDSGVNWLYGYAGDDTLNGDAGDDWLHGGAGSDVHNGGNGRDRAEYTNAGAGVTADLSNSANNTGDAAGDTFSSIEDLGGSNYGDALTGDSGVNRLYGNGGNDTLDGGGGNDLLIGGGGADQHVGGSGIDRALYSTSQNGVTASLLDASTNTGDAAGDTYSSIEDLTGSNHDDVLTGDNNNNELRGNAGDDELMGLDGNDVLIGGSGVDTLNGGDGNDVLRGGAGGDVLNGGAGRDQVSYSGASVGITASLMDTAANTGDAAGDIYSDIEDLRGTGHGDDLTGDDGNNRLYGSNGNDTISGEGGDDLLYGGTGADIMDGGAGYDRANYTTATSAMTINLSDETYNTGDAAGDLFTNIEDLGGGRFGDNLIGDGGMNRLYGNGGADTLDGGAGNDILYGGSGGDTLMGGAGIDRAQYTTSNAGVVVNMTDTSQNTRQAVGDSFDSIEDLGGSVHDDTLKGDGQANSLYGFSGNDALNGEGGDDNLYGSSGNDTLDGGAGDDLLRGGTGVDTFVFTEGADDVDDYSADILRFDRDLWGGADLTAAQILTYASVVSGDTVFDFGSGNTLTIEGHTAAISESLIEDF